MMLAVLASHRVYFLSAGTQKRRITMLMWTWNVVHYNQPVLMSVFQNPGTMEEKVIVIVVLPGGTENAEFTLVGPGPGTRTARIEYHGPN